MNGGYDDEFLGEEKKRGRSRRKNASAQTPLPSSGEGHSSRTRRGEDVTGRSRRRPERENVRTSRRRQEEADPFAVGGWEEEEAPRFSHRRQEEPLLPDTRRRSRARRTKETGTGERALQRNGSRRAEREKKGKHPKRGRIIAVVLLECLLLCVFFGIRYINQKMSLIQRDDTVDMEQMTNPNISVEKEETMKGYWTVALFGVDARNGNLGAGTNADVIIICNVNQETGEIKLVSVFRDTYLNIDDNSSYNKINLSYAKGGPAQAIEALNKNLDIQIDDYATFNWKAVADAINILGGVDVEISKAEFYYINAFITETVEATGVASVHLTSAGLNHLDGVQAVAYARLRKMDTDYARTERQRLIMQLCFEKLKASNFSVINNVMEVVLEQIKTTISYDDIVPVALNIANYTIADTMGFPSARTSMMMGTKGDCVIPETLESNVVDLHEFLFGDVDYEPSSMVKSISAKISADSGMYSEGTPVDHVSTDGGYVPSETTAAQTTAASTKADEEDEDEDDEDVTEDEEDEEEDDEDVTEDEEDEDDDEEEDTYDPDTDGRFPAVVTPATTAAETATTAAALSPGSTVSSTESTAALSPGDEADEVVTDISSGPGSVTSTTAADTETKSKGTFAPYPGANTEETTSSGPGSVVVGPSA